MNERQTRELKRIRDEFAKCPHPIVTDNFTVDEFTIPAADGSPLAVILYRPVLEGPLPTFAMRTCYPHADYEYRAKAEEYAKRGFVFVYQYCRGSGPSGGAWDPNENERADGKLFIDWVAAQDYVGNIGYAGCSYLALTGWAIADILPDKVKTLYLTHYGTFRHVSAFKDGLFRHDVLTGWAMNNAGFLVKADYEASCRYMPHEEVDTALWGGELPWYRKWVTSTDGSAPYWTAGTWGLLKEIPGRVKVPVYIGEGWYDHHLGSAIVTYKALSEEVKKKSTFLIGAWNHGFEMAVEDIQGENFGNEDTLRTFEWFYSILVDGAVPTGGIDTYIIGDDSWHTRETYEIENQEHITYAFGVKDGKKVLTPADAEEAVGTVSYIYDPKDPVRSYGAESCFSSPELQGSKKQPGPDYRSDVVSFLSEPAAESYSVLGSIRVHLTVSTDAEDTCFVARVMEVKKDGSTYNMRTGITTLGYRNGAPSRVTYTPDTEVGIDIDMWDLGWKVQKGSRIRVDIQSSDFPQYAIHSNYPGVFAKIKETKTARQTIHMGDGKSYISLPVLS